jgi:putative hydrolase of the HAD superfamily
MPATLIDWSSIDHVLLDLDGTVLDLAYDNHFWYELVPRRFAQRLGVSVDEANARLDPEFKATLGTLNWYCLDYWSRFTGLDIVAMKAEVRHRIAPLPGSEDFLNAVRSSGRPLWLATNAHYGAWRLKLAETGFGRYFDQVLCSHDFGAPKEDARFWPALRARHEFDPARTLFADDNLSVLRAAKAYGIAQVIAIRHPDSSAPKRVIDEFPAVDRLSELLPIA